MGAEASTLDFNIRRIVELSPNLLDDLVVESELQGFRFLRRLVDDWASGENRFSQSGEALFVADRAGHVVGVGGLNIDPYAGSPKTGRVRRFYVSALFRRQKAGSRLIEAIVAFARSRFTMLRLYTSSPNAAQFYSSVGFSACDDFSHCTHVLVLKRDANDSLDHI
jgi:GNAT superfamily N-acetyltransferase